MSKKTNKILIDTNILGNLLTNENPDVVNLVKKSIGIENVLIPAVVAMEIKKRFWSYKGFTDKDIENFKKFLSSLPIVQIDRRISREAINLYSNYKEASMQIPDMLIAATAITLKIKLYTLNVKDFKFIKGVNLYNS